jgi:hypothetical protein
MPRVRVRVLAQRVHLGLARLARTARDRERHHDAVADLEVSHRRADVDDLAHELVAEDVAFLHRRYEAVVEVEIRAADRGRRDLHDRVARVEDLRIGYARDPYVLLAHPARREHGYTSAGRAG